VKYYQVFAFFIFSTGNVRYDTLLKEEKVGGTLFESMTQQLQEKQETTQIAAAIESLLFVSGRPLEYAELRKLLDVDDEGLTSSLAMLNDQLESQGRGIRLQRLGEQVQLVTAPENARYIAALLDLPMTARLTTAAMETLAVIAYRQPITRAQIEAIRGVNSDRAVASLVQHGLVVEIGRAQTIGRPALFATTPEFLQQFGLTGLEQLPRTESESQSTETGRE
jgi:segregation and condensation protein B